MMKGIMTIVISLLVIASYAQKKAVTENGEEVLLFDDGTWKMANGNAPTNTEIKVNPKNYVKNTQSTFLLKSSKLNVGFWLDPKKWNFEKAKNNPDAEFELKLKDGDLYGMIITEKIEIPVETLKRIAFENAQKIAPDLTIVNEEYRTVNGLKVLHLQMRGTMQGIKFFYFGYYYTSSQGTLQYMTYSSQNLLDSYLAEIENLINGLVELK